jgi:hypothetical protein
MIRSLMALTAAASLAGLASAQEPCTTCKPPLAKHLHRDKGPVPKCDSDVYPKVEYFYIKRYCGPVISPNATYGYFQTQWRPWDGGTATACVTPQQSTAPAAKPDEPAAIPDMKSKTPMPPPATGKESAPAPKSGSGRTTLSPVGSIASPEPVSPGVIIRPN